MPDEISHATHSQASDLSYPIGKFDMQQSAASSEERNVFIAQIAETPSKLRAAVAGLSAQQFDTPYRPGGWTVRQLVHHIPDSHMNAFIRFKLALTEPEPTIKPYDEALWADLPDVRSTPVEVSMQLLENLHQRWVLLLRGLRPADWSRTFRHPEMGVMTLGTSLAHYAWHSRHHVAHITALRQRMGW
jgi:uncharacterized damage-inducible protein DinB